MLQLLTHFVLGDTEMLFPQHVAAAHKSPADGSQLEPVTSHCVAVYENMGGFVWRISVFPRTETVEQVCVLLTHPQSGGCMCAGCR